MKNTRAVRKLETLAELEERGVAIIAKHLHRAVERSTLSMQERQRILDILDRIARESEAHHQVLKMLISQLDGCRGEQSDTGACQTAETA